jgi:hypothetical protein
MQGFIISGLALVAAELALLAYGRRKLACILALFASGCFLGYGIISHSPLQIGLAGGNILAFLALLFRGGPRGRHRTREELGDESRQLRDGLVRCMRQCRVTRRGTLPQPSR